MRTYEVACVLKAEEALFTAGKDEISALLTELGSESIDEIDMGLRTLAYPIKNEIQARYLVFKMKMEPDNAHTIEERVKHFTNLLRILVIRKDN